MYLLGPLLPWKAEGCYCPCLLFPQHARQELVQRKKSMWCVKWVSEWMNGWSQAPLVGRPLHARPCEDLFFSLELPGSGMEMWLISSPRKALGAPNPWNFLEIHRAEMPKSTWHLQCHRAVHFTVKDRQVDRWWIDRKMIIDMIDNRKTIDG